MSRYRAFIILLLDVLIIFLCNFLTMLPYLLGQDIRLLNLVLHIGLLTVCVLLFQVCLKTYDTLWRYAESREYLTLLEGMGLGFTLYSVVNLLLGTSRIWISSALTGTALALLVMLGYRFVYRSYRRRVTGVGGGPRAYAAIIGAGSAGAALVSEMDDRIYGRYRPYCVIDDAAEKQQKRIHGVPVLGPIDAMEEILADTPVTDIILAIQNLTPERRQEILNLCARTQRRVHVLGSPVTRLHARQGDYIAAVREVEIEDLLGRAPVQLENPRIGTFLRGKTVLVTGGGGSIGSELCRQIAANRPERLVILDVAENTTYELQNDLLHWYGEDFPLSVEIASVRDRQRLEQIFAKYRPQLVFHAAAHKHVPLMEGCPEEAVENNVFGTFNTADMARRYGAEKFVLISTDKAVNPTNIMGATKNLCEEVLQGLRGVGGTEFAAVRARGLTPVLAHPERYTCVQDEPRLLRRWAREGTVLQANKGSFFGMFGRRAAAAAHWALADGCLHLIASDAHSPYRRTTRMSDIFDFTADFAAEEIADFLLRQNPADILANRPVYTVREKF